MNIKISNYTTKNNLKLTIVRLPDNVRLIDAKTNETFNSFLFSEKGGKSITILNS